MTLKESVKITFADLKFEPINWQLDSKRCFTLPRVTMFRKILAYYAEPLSDGHLPELLSGIRLAFLDERNIL